MASLLYYLLSIILYPLLLPSLLRRIIRIIDDIQTILIVQIVCVICARNLVISLFVGNIDSETAAKHHHVFVFRECSDNIVGIRFAFVFNYFNATLEVDS